MKKLLLIISILLLSLSSFNYVSADDLFYGFESDWNYSTKTEKVDSCDKRENGTTKFEAEFWTNTNPEWLDDVSFEIKDVTPIAIKELFLQMGIVEKPIKYSTTRINRENCNDNGYFEYKTISRAAKSNEEVDVYNGIRLNIKASYADKVLKVVAKKNNKVLDTIYLISNDYSDWQNAKETKGDLEFLDEVERRVMDRLFTDSMTTAEKFSALDEYIEHTTHYPYPENINRNEESEFLWNRYAVDGKFNFYSVNLEGTINTAMKYHGGYTDCYAAFDLYAIGTKLGLKQGDGKSNNVIGIRAPSYNPNHRIFQYLDQDGVVHEYNTEGISSLKNCEKSGHCTKDLLDLSGKNVTPTTIKSNGNVDILVGETKDLELICSPLYASETLKYKSENNNIVSVDEYGAITAKSTGTTNIVVTSTVCDTVVKIKVVVKGVIEATGLEVYPKEINYIHSTKDYYLSTKVYPDNASYKYLIFESSDPGVVKVDSNGKLNVGRTGQAIITVKTHNGISETINFSHVSSFNFITCNYENDFWWIKINGKYYWQEHGEKQGVFGDPKNIKGDGSERGREIYDPCSNGWYWLDTIYDGAKAEGKEVWVPYIYQEELNFSDSERNAKAYELSQASNGYSEDGVIADMSSQVYDAIINKKGKWVRYNANGRMAKGWYTVEGPEAIVYPNQAGNTYYYDQKTGLMAKGWTTINGINYYFNEVTGVLERQQ